MSMQFNDAYTSIMHLPIQQINECHLILLYDTNQADTSGQATMNVILI